MGVYIESFWSFFEKLGFFIIDHFWKFVLFCFVGFMALLIEWLFFNIIYKISSLFIFSIITAAIISMTFNFTVNRTFTFTARGFAIKKQIIRWLMVYAIVLLVNVVVSKTVLIIIGDGLINANIAFFAGVAASLPISFFGSLFWAFKKK